MTDVVMLAETDEQLELCEDAPEDACRVNAGVQDGVDDEEGSQPAAPGLVAAARLLAVAARAEPTGRDTEGTLAWYRANGAKPPFHPDGMCLKVCRVARDLPAVFPSALAAQQATPQAHRIDELTNVRRGHVVYYDHPNDPNPFGHIVTVAGRAKGESRDDLRSLIVWTNSVRSGRIVPVRGDFFPRHWGDPFVFASDWLNGRSLDMGSRDPDPKPKPKGPDLGPNPVNLNGAIESLQEGEEHLRRAIAHHRKEGHTTLVAALERDITQMNRQIKALRRRIKKFS